QWPAGFIVVAAPEGRIMHANRGAAEMVGQSYPPPFLNAEWSAAVSAVKGWHSKGSVYSASEWPLARSLSTGESIADEQIEVIGPQGTRCVLSVSSSPVRDPAN